MFAVIFNKDRSNSLITVLQGEKMYGDAEQQHESAESFSRESRKLKRVLIVSPRFPPINAPDHQRVRMSLPYFAQFGWEPVILAVRPELHPEYNDGKNLDTYSAKSLPLDLEIIETKAVPVPPIKVLGAANLGVRCLPQLNKAGSRLIRERKIDAVYFSTTMFPVMALGRRWRERFGVPYMLDFQDPWLSDYYDQPNAPPPPGGRLKYGVSQSLARLLEPYALRRASHIISVSPAYPSVLMKRYGWLRPEQFTVLPFGAPEADFEQVKRLDVKQSIVPTDDGRRHWVYVGRGGGDMHFALKILFTAIREERERDPEIWKKVKLHFVGTNYAAGDRAVKVIEPVAVESGVGDLVEEHVHRVGYFEALKILLDSDAILLIGSNDPSYTASKIYPCVLARRPILALFHEQSSVVDILRRCNAGRIVTFGEKDKFNELIRQTCVELRHLLQMRAGESPATNWDEFAPYTAREMTRKQCEALESLLV